VLVHGPLTGLDERIRAAVLARADSPAWRWLSDSPHRPAPLLTDLGMYAVAVPILAAVAVALAIRRHTLRPVLIALTGIVLLLGTVIPAKIIIGRPGPGLPAVLPGQLGVFPSGHTSTACICFSLAVLMLVAGQPARTRHLALAALALLWLGVGVALVWCDYHWFTDVVAAWALSGLLIQLTFWINRAGRPWTAARCNRRARAGLRRLTRPGLSLLGFLLLRWQRCHVPVCPLDPACGDIRGGPPDPGQAQVTPHRPPGRPERAIAGHRRQFLPPGVIEPHAHVGPEQSGEHVPVHERAEVAEHRLDLDLRIVWKHRPEKLFVCVRRLWYLHTPSRTLPPDGTAARTAPGGGFTAPRKQEPGLAPARDSRAAGVAGSPRCLLEAPHPAGRPLGSLLLRLVRLIYTGRAASLLPLGRLIAARPD
jgi:membrane-associated phospholipid phosphatase